MSLRLLCALIGGMLPVTIVVAAAARALVLVSMVTKPPPATLVERFFPPRGSIK